MSINLSLASADRDCPDWITSAELRSVYKQAEFIADDFWANKFMEGEETWNEVWVVDKAFDINCYEEDYDGRVEERNSPVHVSVYPTYETDRGYRETNGELYFRLFSINP